MEIEAGRIVLRWARPPVRALLQALVSEDPEAVQVLGEASGHDALAFVRVLRGGDDGL